MKKILTVLLLSTLTSSAALAYQTTYPFRPRDPSVEVDWRSVEEEVPPPVTAPRLIRPQQHAPVALQSDPVSSIPLEPLSDAQRTPALRAVNNAMYEHGLPPRLTPPKPVKLRSPAAAINDPLPVFNEPDVPRLMIVQDPPEKPSTPATAFIDRIMRQHLKPGQDAKFKVTSTTHRPVVRIPATDTPMAPPPGAAPVPPAPLPPVVAPKMPEPKAPEAEAKAASAPITWDTEKPKAETAPVALTTPVEEKPPVAETVPTPMAPAPVPAPEAKKEEPLAPPAPAAAIEEKPATVAVAPAPAAAAEVKEAPKPEPAPAVEAKAEPKPEPAPVVEAKAEPKPEPAPVAEASPTDKPVIFKKSDSADATAEYKPVPQAKIEPVPAVTEEPAPLPPPVAATPAPAAKPVAEEKKAEAPVTPTAPEKVVVSEPAPTPAPAAEQKPIVLAASPAEEKTAEPVMADLTTPPKMPEAVPAPAEKAAEEKIADAAPAPVAPASSAPAVPSHSDMSLSFDATSSTLTPAMEKQLDNIAAQMNELQETRLQIRAYATGEDGNASSARRMSLSRALVVRSYLTDKGIKPLRLDVRALGTETDRTPKDRADLVFVK